MGTRNLTIVKVKGKIKVAQYCQWDGYPTGQGKDIARFIHSKAFDLAALRKNVSKLTWAKPAEIKDTWTQCGADPESNTVSMSIADVHSKRYPEFSRDTGAKVLPLIQRGKVSKVQNDYAFIKDSLFCEYAYEIDLDRKTVKVFKGFQATGKMVTQTRSDGTTYQAEGYAPCKAIKTYSFKDFTCKAMDLLTKELNKEES